MRTKANDLHSYDYVTTGSTKKCDDKIFFLANRKGSTEDYLGLFIKTSCVLMEFKLNNQKKFSALSKLF